MADKKSKQLVHSLLNVKNVAYLAKVDEGRWLMEFMEGEARGDEAWFLKMSDGKEEFVAIPQKALQNLLLNMQKTHEEKLQVLLRYEIRDLMPKDLEDTMAVAMYELEKCRLSNGNLPMIDVHDLAQKIRIEHPNLFLSWDSDWS